MSYSDFKDDPLMDLLLEKNHSMDFSRPRSESMMRGVDMSSDLFDGRRKKSPRRNGSQCLSTLQQAYPKYTFGLANGRPHFRPSPNGRNQNLSASMKKLCGIKKSPKRSPRKKSRRSRRRSRK